MKTLHIETIPGFEEWRDKARHCLSEYLSPSQVVWHTDSCSVDFFDFYQSAEMRAELINYPITVPKAFLAMAETAACHKDSEKYNLLYRVLWRLNRENKHLLKLLTDDDILRLNTLIKAVRHDAYKITAFLRFREVKHQGEEYFVAWYEPEHYTLERVLPFFQTRFRNMRWSILTPYRAAHWDMNEMILENNPDPELYPKEDEVEKYWLGYYANIFNPARPKKSAMLNQMPKKYWKNMPETALVPELLRTANEKARQMILRGQGTAVAEERNKE